jgi:hypothetical protein
MKTIARRVRRLESGFASETESAFAQRLHARVEAGRQRLAAHGYPTIRLAIDHGRTGSQLEDILQAGRMRNAALNNGVQSRASSEQISG